MMKRSILIAATVLAAGGLFGLTLSSALADSPRGEGTSSTPGEFWEHMNEMRTIMHGAQVKGENVEKGVRIEATSTQPEVTAAIKEEFGSARHKLEPPFPNTEVTAKLIENGVVLTYTSSDPAGVQQLQYYGTGLFYGLLRNNMHELMASQTQSGPYGQPCFQGGPYAGRMGPGMMGSGYGRGWQHGPGYGRGGMMGPGYGRGGMMGPGYGHGYGRGGMMGPGYGPGPAQEQAGE